MEPQVPSTRYIWGVLPVYSVFLHIFFKFQSRGALLPGSSRSAAIERGRERERRFVSRALLRSFLKFPGKRVTLQVP